MISLFRVIKFAFQGFFRNFWLSVVTITMMLMAIFSVTLMMGLDYFKENAIKGVKEKVDILVDIRPNVERDTLETMVDEIEELDQISQINIITPDENKELFKENNAGSDISLVLDIFDEDENPFTYSLTIKARELTDYKIIKEFIEQDKYAAIVDTSTFRDHQIFVDRINNISELINKYSLYIVIAFILISIIVIFNTIRISIYTRKDEISIMKLVGANNWFIRMPFILESILYALSAVGISILVFYPLIDHVIQPSLNNYFQDNQVMNLSLYFRDNFVRIFVMQFVVISLINISSTMFAIRKYLSV